MTETIESMVTPIDQLRLPQQLVEQARAEGVELIGPGGLLTGLTKSVLETALEAEMSEHLGCDKHDAMGRNDGNSRNGARTKTVFTEIGPVEIQVPRIGMGPSSRRSCVSRSGVWTVWIRSCCR
jgi:putative transposase